MMKKNLLFLSVALLSAGMLTGCKDDAPSVSETVRNTYAAEKVKLDLGSVVSGKEPAVQVAPRSEQTATLTFKNAFPGVTDKVIDDFEMVKKADSVVLTHGRVDLNADYRIDTLYGSVKAGVLTMNARMTCISPIAKTWEVSATSILPLECELEIAADKILIFGTMQEKDMLPNMVKLAGAMMLPEYLKSITFNENGTITAMYKAGENWVESPKGLITYMIADGKIYLKPNMSALMGLIPGGSLDMSTIPEGLMPLITMVLGQGVPLNYAIDDKGILAVTVSKDLLSIVIPGVSGLIPEGTKFEIAGMLTIDLNELIGELKTIVNDATKFDISLNCTPAPAPSPAGN